MSDLTKKLAEIQQCLKAPKGQYNAFAKFYYRSAEDILEAVKPLLGDASLTISDQMVEVGGRVYLQSTVRLSQGVDHREATAVAREPDSKKGMDSAQISGATSSYARKYALNGLFAIDDSKADADAGSGQAKPSKQQAAPITVGQLQALEELSKHFTPDKIRDGVLWATGGQSQSPIEMSKAEADKLVGQLRKKGGDK